MAALRCWLLWDLSLASNSRTSPLYNFDGHITGPAIYYVQQVEPRGVVLWVPLLVVIGVLESYRVGLGWATPQSQDFNSLRDD